MAIAKNSCLFLFFIYLLLVLNLVDSKCEKSFNCGTLGSLQFPLARESGCGLFIVDGCGSDTPKLQLQVGGRWYDILRNGTTNSFVVRDPQLQSLLDAKSCFTFENLSFPTTPYSSFTVYNNLTVFTCFRPSSGDGRTLEDFRNHFVNYTERICDPSSFTMYYKDPRNGGEASKPDECSRSEVPMKSLPEQDQDWSDLFDLLTAEYTLEWHVSDACYSCHNGGGQCLTNAMNEFVCQRGGGDRKWKLILGISGGVLAFLLCLVIIYLVIRRRKKKGGYFLSRNISSTLSSKSDIEGGSFYFGIPIFSYEELEKATNKFDQTKELGDGGFGTVYYGKLEDGREVAIKRLYEHNYRRVEQFLNEIKILTCLRHPNLVSLYGCTSRRSRELLLVYEYVSNGTVADHLHGERAKEAPLTWPIRMNVAIETAIALAYLHNSDIIHRDVKTNNILLDSNFCVKVADFGLSRLFPMDVTHISTAPQGTPGYVDPEYHQCYQLTDKSDVYSFGVVLIELISSMPAVDISRHRHEINLANLAMNRIQRCAFDELIDPSLGYDTDPEVTRMTTSVAELAFRCLQLEKDLRPSMDEVVCFLKEIKYGEDCDFEQMKGVNAPGKIPPSPETDDAILLKNKAFQSSPTAVTDAWISSDSTTASSIG